jgi:thiol:disulfide interchange protein
MKLRLLCISVLFAGSAALWTGCSTPSSHTAPASSASQTIYDPSADGEQQLNHALKKARKESKYVLLDLGANWCSDSQATYRLLKNDPAITAELQRHYVLTLVDVNQRDGADRNKKLLERLGNPISRGIPILLVISPDGDVLNKDATERLRDDAHKEPGKVLTYLLKWAPPAGMGGL